MHVLSYSRGWEVIEERTLQGVTKDYLDISRMMNRIMDFSQESNDTGDNEALLIRWAAFESILLNRIGRCERAIANLTSIHKAYTTGEPLLTYRYSKVCNSTATKLCAKKSGEQWLRMSCSIHSLFGMQSGTVMMLHIQNCNTTIEYILQFSDLEQIDWHWLCNSAYNQCSLYSRVLHDTIW